MQNSEIDKLLRVYILDTLVSQSGKILNPEVIGQLTSELIERIQELWVNENEFK